MQLIYQFNIVFGRYEKIKYANRNLQPLAAMTTAVAWTQTNKDRNPKNDRDVQTVTDCYEVVITIKKGDIVIVTESTLQELLASHVF